ncbi:MAG: hypothetical protein LBK52_00560 [Deltaproteobacteria bacterium]|jgi:hypothetical protein|nr:hypothetical protein [Deltaproteobacteria bacterium]
MTDLLKVFNAVMASYLSAKRRAGERLKSTVQRAQGHFSGMANVLKAAHLRSKRLSGMSYGCGIHPAEKTGALAALAWDLGGRAFERVFPAVIHQRLENIIIAKQYKYAKLI